jgi:hypothetical protein
MAGHEEMQIDATVRPGQAKEQEVGALVFGRRTFRKMGLTRKMRSPDIAPISAMRTTEASE